MADDLIRWKWVQRVQFVPAGVVVVLDDGQRVGGPAFIEEPARLERMAGL